MKEDEEKNKKKHKVNNKTEEGPIKKDMYIMELVMNYPETMELLLEAGLHCIGCGLSQYETLEEGAMGHGWDEEDLNYLVDELNKRVKEIYGDKKKEDKKKNGRENKNI